MDPALAAPIATLAGAVATAILMWASYNYPRGYHRRDAERDEDSGSRRSIALPAAEDPESDEAEEPEAAESEPDPAPSRTRAARPPATVKRPVAKKPVAKKITATKKAAPRKPPRKRSATDGTDG